MDRWPVDHPVRTSADRRGQCIDVRHQHVVGNAGGLGADHGAKGERLRASSYRRGPRRDARGRQVAAPRPVRAVPCRRHRRVQTGTTTATQWSWASSLLGAASASARSRLAEGCLGALDVARSRQALCSRECFSDGPNMRGWSVICWRRAPARIVQCLRYCPRGHRKCGPHRLARRGQTERFVAVGVVPVHHRPLSVYTSAGPLW